MVWYSTAQFSIESYYPVQYYNIILHYTILQYKVYIFYWLVKIPTICWTWISEGLFSTLFSSLWKRAISRNIQQSERFHLSFWEVCAAGLSYKLPWGRSVRRVKDGRKIRLQKAPKQITFPNRSSWLFKFNPFCSRSSDKEGCTLERKHLTFVLSNLIQGYDILKWNQPICLSKD